MTSIDEARTTERGTRDNDDCYNEDNDDDDDDNDNDDNDNDDNDNDVAVLLGGHSNKQTDQTDTATRARW